MGFLDRSEFVGAMTELVKRADSPELDAHQSFWLRPTDLPWVALDLDASAGQAVTFFLGGRVWLSREADAWVEPGVAFHVRSRGRGPMYNPMRNHGTLIAAHDGPLEIARSTAEWENEDGELWTPVEEYAKADAEIYGLALRWKGDAAAGLRSLLAAGDFGGAVRRELDRVETAAPLPSGWHHHFNTGGGDVIFRDAGDGQIACRSHKTGGLLRHPAPLPLAPETRLSWRWNVEELPSLHAEDQLLTHDYLSIGVEFDDGQDLTYLWSRHLPVGTGFRCPIPRWAPIETHVVVRSGLDEIGQWLAEERDVYNDYRDHVGGDAERIVRVWLLAVTIFQRRGAACRFADICLRAPDGEVRIL